MSYQITKKYPGDERYSLTSQDRRASLSVMLNYVEGHGRIKLAVKQNFYETAFGSLKESIYCKFLACELEYIQRNEYEKVFALKEEISAMLYATIRGIEKDRGEQNS